MTNGDRVIVDAVPHWESAHHIGQGGRVYNIIRRDYPVPYRVAMDTGEHISASAVRPV